MQPKISVLVPFFNCEKYISRCVKSIAAQRFEGFDIVFINDCSTDNSRKVLDETLIQYKELDYKILENAQNYGVAYCRNRLLEAAKGDYIIFFDADDWIEPDTLELMYERAIADNADVVVADFFYETRQKTIETHDFVASTREENLRNAIEQRVVYCALWNKLIHRRLFQNKDVAFVEGLNMSEDRLLVIKLYAKATRISKINKPLYHYNRTNENSITLHKTEFHYRQAILFWQYFDQFIEDQNIYETYRKSIEYSKVENKVLLMQQVRSIRLHRRYGYMFEDIEAKFIGAFPYKSQNLTLYFAHRKMFVTAYLVNLFLRLKIWIFSRL